MYDAGGGRVSGAADRFVASLFVMVVTNQTGSRESGNIFVAATKRQEGCLSVAKVPAELKRPYRANPARAGCTGKNFRACGKWTCSALLPS